jgi:inosose dehydratase
LQKFSEQIRFASAPVSWGVQDDPGPAWEQPYGQILEDIVSAGFAGTELGPFGYFPTDPGILNEALQRLGLAMLSSFVPVPITELSRVENVIEHVRRVGALLSALGSRLVVLADCQTPQRREIAGRVPLDGSKSLTLAQWKHVGAVIRQVEQAAAEFDLRVVFHPHVATFVETPMEVERLFEVLAGTQVGLCLDTGHCVYGGGDPVDEARKYRSVLHYVHIKDVDAGILGEARRQKLHFDQAIGAGVFTRIGNGCIDFDGFFRFLAESSYSGWVIVEQDVIYGKTLVPPTESMRSSLSYLKNVMSKISPAD